MVKPDKCAGDTPISEELIATEPSDIGRIVRERRKRAGLTQASAAALCKVGTRFLSELENGKPTLHIGKVLRVLSGFGIQVVLRKKGLSHA